MRCSNPVVITCLAILSPFAPFAPCNVRQSAGRYRTHCGRVAVLARVTIRPGIFLGTSPSAPLYASKNASAASRNVIVKALPSYWGVPPAVTASVVLPARPNLEALCKLCEYEFNVRKTAIP